MADARYCPVYAFARYIVTDTGLLQQPALDRVLIHSVDRVTGAPVPNLPVEGEVTGQYILHARVTVPDNDASAEEYRRGFYAAWGGNPSEAEATPSYTQGFQSAVRFRAEHPDVKFRFQGTTDKDGLYDWTVAPAWKEGYQYTIRTTSTHEGSWTRVESTYNPAESGQQLLALVYADRPIYRAGDSVSFKALLRRRDGEGLHPYEGRDALVEIGTADRTIYVRSLPVSDFGTASGSLDLHDGLARDAYWVRVNNGSRQPLFKIEDYRKPEFEIVLSAPKRVRAGEAVDIPVLVRRYSGEPVVKTSVVLNIRMARTPGSARLMDAGGWEVPGSQESWKTVEQRILDTDGEGRCLFRFQTDENVAARYVARPASGRSPCEKGSRRRPSSRRRTSRKSWWRRTARPISRARPPPCASGWKAARRRGSRSGRRSTSLSRPPSLCATAQAAASTLFLWRRATCRSASATETAGPGRPSSSTSSRAAPAPASWTSAWTIRSTASARRRRWSSSARNLMPRCCSSARPGRSIGARWSASRTARRRSCSRSGTTTARTSISSP
jgi:hypothetical protein